MQYTRHSFLCNWLARFYAFYQRKHIGIPTCTQHLLTRSARRPDDDRLKRSKHVASCTLNSCAWRILINVKYVIILPPAIIFYHEYEALVEIHILNRGYFGHRCITLEYSDPFWEMVRQEEWPKKGHCIYAKPPPPIPLTITGQRIIRLLNNRSRQYCLQAFIS